MATIRKWIVICSNGLHIRESASSTSSSLGFLYKNEVVTEISQATVKNSSWIQHSRGWSCAALGNATYMKLYTETEEGTISSTTTVNSYAVEETSATEENSSGFQPELSSIFVWTNTFEAAAGDENYYTIYNALSILGLPYQYMAHVDPRISDVPGDQLALGGEYAERIIGRMPLLLMTPGKANFMTRYNTSDKKTVLNELITTIGEENKSLLSDLLSKEGRYYTFEYRSTEYYNYVNPMCRIAARYLDLQDYTLDGVSLDNVDWMEYTGNRIAKFADIPSMAKGGMGAVPFYINSETSISESFSNSTTESTLASTVNSVSDYGRELKFLLGYSAAATNLDTFLQDTDINTSVENVQSMISGLLGKNSFINNLSTHLSTVATGGKLQFPQIWSDSTFGKSYDINIKLTSPDCDKLSIYLNILVPLFHLIGFVAPQSLNANPNGFTNPFLVRAVYKGMFNVDMGIITNMNINKGAEGMWTPDGIPTTVEVNFTVKDLYEIMSITNMGNTTYDTLTNTALMDYIANTCGINIYKPEIGRAIDMWLVNKLENRITDIVRVNLWGGINDSISNSIMNIYRKNI